MPGIGILSSIDYNPRMQARFEAGLNTHPLPYIAPPQDSLGYDTTALNMGLDNLNNDPNVSLIVTFGGNIVSDAAIHHAVRPPFISLVGGVIVTPPQNQFWGCVSLESFVLDSVRLAWLNTQGFVSANVGLLYNSHSFMHAQELAAWAAAGGGQVVDATNGWNNPTHFGDDFNNFGGGITAVVISADPYFQKNRDNLILAGDNFRKYICYPFRDYANLGGAHQPTHGRAVIIGPDLLANNQDGAYFLMGAMAASTGPNFDQHPNPAVNKGVAQVIWPL
jgi:hypothetical protein